MEDKYVRNSLRFFIGVLLLVVLYSCANIASPNGGPYDEAPPKFVSSTPLPGQINYKGKKVEIIFDELLHLGWSDDHVLGRLIDLDQLIKNNLHPKWSNPLSGRTAGRRSSS